MKSLKKNYILYLLRTILNLLFPLITFPYICRILGPENQGKVTYLSSVIALFTMAAQLGIPTYGLRECSKVNTEKNKLKQFIVEISIVQILTTFFCSVFYIVYITIFIKGDIALYFIFLPQIFFATFNFDYYYTATENQKLLTERFIFVRLLEIILLFTFVRGKNALILYAILTTLGQLLNFIINIYGLKELVKEKIYKKIELKQHIKPIIIIFFANIAITIYANLDNVMVGNMVSVEAVGFYGVANKIVRIIITIAIATSTVLFPRLQQSRQNEDWNSYARYSRDYLCYTLMFSIPALIGLILLAKEIILITAGERYLPAVISMQILAPILIIVPLANFFGGMILMVNNKETYYTISVSIAALLNVIANYFLIPIYHQNGAIIGTLLAETIGLSLEILFSWKYLKGIKQCFINIVFYIIAAIIMFICIKAFKDFFVFPIITDTMLCILLGITSYSFVLLFLREQYISNVLQAILIRVRIKK